MSLRRAAQIAPIAFAVLAWSCGGADDTDQTTTAAADSGSAEQQATRSEAVGAESSAGTPSSTAPGSPQASASESPGAAERPQSSPVFRPADGQPDPPAFRNRQHPVSVEVGRRWWGKPFIQPTAFKNGAPTEVWFYPRPNDGWESTDPSCSHCGFVLSYEYAPVLTADSALSEVWTNGGVIVEVEHIKDKDDAPYSEPYWAEQTRVVAGRTVRIFDAVRGENPGVNVSFRWLRWEETAPQGLLAWSITVNSELYTLEETVDLLESAKFD